MSKCTLLEKHSSSAPHVDDFIAKHSSSKKPQSLPKDSSRSKTSIRAFHDRFSEGLFEKERIQAAIAELTEEWNLAESL